MSFQKVLEKYRKYSFSEKDKGDRFERLMQAFLKTYPLYANKLKEVWLWNEFPFKNDFSGKDTGIDLVAKTNSGDYWAIQCKCYLETTTIDKAGVDSFLATSSKRFKDENLQGTSFSNRLWISTTNKWNNEAEKTIQNQTPPLTRLSLTELENAPVDWEVLEKGISGEEALFKRKQPFEHQKEAINKVHEYFKIADRGKLIMACGTGKTFTSLKIAEKETHGKGTILFLVPSIALLGQTLNEWSAEATEKLDAICICSDPEASKKKLKNEDTNLYSVTDLALPASTNVPNIIKQFHDIKKENEERMTVVFSTYQSIDVISKAQKELNKKKSDNCIFDLIICDEAHRTTGVTRIDEDESTFVKVHDNNILYAKKRLYMTATPRLYSEDTKSKAKESEALLCSMDDVAIYGKEIHRIGFSEAVRRGLLSDYKVLVLTLSDEQIPEGLQKAIADKSYEINTDDASKLIGCINALSKRMLVDANLLKESDPSPMHRAVAFCPKISDSTKIRDIFNTHKEAYYESLSAEEREEVVTVEADHVDGTMGASTRDAKLSWLKNTPTDSKDCRILTNVRCLSEGVDVPTLDAVMFLSARNSQVDVVQSVGRVMRRAEGKKYGYIIIPVLVPSDVKPEEALDDNERFKVVWTVLNALRAHDDRFNAMVNKIDLNKAHPNLNGQMLVGGVPVNEDNNGGDSTRRGEGKEKSKELSKNFVKQLTIKFDELQSVIYARMVQKVGNKRYWEDWASDVAKIAERHIERINKIIDKNKKYKDAFNKFIEGLHTNINPYITKTEAVEMLAQHLITQPVFEALFENYSFVENNPISKSMQQMLDLLEEQSLDKDRKILDKFYTSVKQRVEGIDNAEGKQRIIIELYDKFFKTAFPKVVEKLGIVYTPVEVVDFIINSVSDVLKKEFDRSISDENIHILDPFTGTGTFITRLIQSGLINKKDLERKYKKELHANEIVLLAYYIASINIENAFQDAFNKNDDYIPFEGICLTDTFQLGEKIAEFCEDEKNKKVFSEIFPQNSERVIAQKKAPLRVIMGNPPYSVGQKSANDNAQNQKYEKLDGRIADTYAKYSKATNKNSLYDSYIKAFRWSSDRLDPKNGGVIAFITNGIWLDNNVTDGFRKCLEEEFSSIYVFNLRGGIRGKSGDLAKKEGQNVFDIMTGVSITVLVKKPDKSNEKAKIYYHDIGDYLKRNEKLQKIKDFKSVTNEKIIFTKIQPNEHFDWLNKRSNIFENFIPLGEKKDKNIKTVFEPYYSNGLKTQRDSWCYNSSKNILENNIRNTLDFYNKQRLEHYESFIKAKNKNKDTKIDEFISFDDTKISWTRQLKWDLEKNKEFNFINNSSVISQYRPFFKQYLYFDRALNEMVYQQPKSFPSVNHSNSVICISTDVRSGFSVLISNMIPDLSYVASCQCFPLYWYEKNEKTQMSLFDKGKDEYIRRDGISDFILQRARENYGHKVTKEDIFYYVYGILHSPEYREKFSADLKKMLPRIPLVDEPKDFWAFSNAGRELADLHINYESVEPYKDVQITNTDCGNYKVEKMKFVKKDDKSTIIYNPKIKISNIPLEAYDYVINGKSAIEWIMDRYQVKIDKKSLIKNDPNDWAEEHNKPKYILDLLLSIITVSLETNRIVKGLPKLKF